SSRTPATSARASPDRSRRRRTSSASSGASDGASTAASLPGVTLRSASSTLLLAPGSDRRHQARTGDQVGLLLDGQTLERAELVAADGTHGPTLGAGDCRGFAGRGQRDVVAGDDLAT